MGRFAGSRRDFLLLVGILTFVLSGLGQQLHAQYAGSLRGTVTDSTGAILPGATVTLTNEATRFQQDVATNDEGQYYFGALQPGSYTISVEMPGFKTAEKTGLRLVSSENARLDLTLEIGLQTETLQVTAEREMIQTESGARDNLITAEQIDNLSIVGRSPIELLRILPGTVSPDVTQLESVGNLTGSANTQGYQVNGIRGTNNVVTLDGSRLIDVGANNGAIVVPNNEMVSEVKVQSSNYAAEYGSAGIQINAVTKGGGSEFHGSVYTYMRHYSWQANDASNRTTGVDRPKSEFYYPGGTLSGPLLIPGTGFNKGRDKAFFFLGVEIQRQQLDNGSSFAVTPTERQRQGFFDDTQGGQNLNQPPIVSIPGGYPGAGTPAPNNDLSPYIDPFGQALINLYPPPNHVDPNNRYNYVFSQLQPQNRTQLVLRLDYNFTASTKAYLRLANDGETLERARGAWWDTSAFELPSALDHKNRGRSAALNVTSVLSPTSTNEILFTWSKLYLDILHQDPEAVSLGALGFPDFAGPWGQQVDMAPVQLYAWGNGLGDLWSPMGQDLFAYNSSLQLTDTFTKVLNTHAIKLGFSVERVRKDQNFANNEQMGFYLGSWIPGTTRNDYGDLLTGRLAQVDSGTLAANGAFQLWNIDFFVQDSWKLRKNLTLEYGVRFSKMTNNIERNGLGAAFYPDFYDPEKGTFQGDSPEYLNGLKYVALGQTDQNLIGTRPLYVMPRVNFAWDVKGDGDLILRGGAGLFYNRPQGNAEYDVITMPPHAYSISIGAYDAVPPGTGGFLTYDNLQYYDPLSRVGTLGANSVNPDSVRYPRLFTTSLSLGKRLPWQQFLEIGYVGTFGRHLLNARNSNVIPEGALLSGQIGNADLSVPVNRVALSTIALNTVKAFPALGAMSFWEFNGTSNYHSLQVTLSRQTSGRFQYFLAYTFSKALGIHPCEGCWIDPFSPRGRNYGVLPYDRTHLLNLSYNWQVPDLTGSDNVVLRGLLNDWQVSGITSFSSGTPMYVGFSGDLANDGQSQAWFGTPDVRGIESIAGNQIKPLVSCDPQRGGTQPGETLLDVGCFQIPGYPEFGPYVPPYYMRSPSRMSWDITFFKNFPLGGSKKLQLRFGLFNVFNQSYATYNDQDIDLRLDTRCNVRRDGVPDGSGGFQNGVCDPLGGFSYTPQTLENFGKILLKRGRRIVEFAVKLYF
jgi:outer membrane receptor protein involved in Fe transport